MKYYLMSNNITFTTRNNLCTGCGVCEDVCPKHCITIVRKNGEHRPVLNEALCLGDKCGRCLKTCPGVGVKLASIAKDVFSDKCIKEDKYIGRYVGLHTGYSLNSDIRLHSASGGMVTQFLIFLLEKKIIDGAVVTGYDKDHITPKSYIARTADDVIKARSSKYCPVALNKMGNEIVRSEGKYVIVGTPCHIQGFRKRAIIDRKFRERILGFFSIYCSSERTFYAQDYLFRHYNVEKSKITSFSFRDNGCLGNLTINQNNNVNIQVPYTKFYGPVLRSFFKPYRCLSCIDHYGELADVCFGDIHIKPYSDDHIGISSWITRSQYWEELFQKAKREGYIYMDDVDAYKLNDSQKTMLYPKKKRAQAVVKMGKILGRKCPIYDKPFESPSLKDYITELVCFAQQFIGKRKCLWFIIEILNKGK